MMIRGRQKSNMVPLYKISEESQIVVVGNAGISGIKIIYDMFRDEIKGQYTDNFLSSIDDYSVSYSYEAEYDIIMRYRYELIVECAFGGVFNALFTLGYETGLGVISDMKAIPITQQTIEISACKGVNPYQLHSSGCLVVAATNGVKLCDALRREGITAEVVGYMTRDKARIVRAHGEERFLVPVRRDELNRFIPDDEMKRNYPKKLNIKAFSEFS